MLPEQTVQVSHIKERLCCIIASTTGACEMPPNERLLTTKIQVPPLPPKTVRRARLLEALDRGLQPNLRLTLISAPAGYGKTTLLSAWIQDRGSPAAWLSIDESDNDPIRFLSYLLAALQRANPDLNLPSPTQGQYSETEIQERILIPLINQMEASARQTTLVLDDYHWIHSQSVHDRLGYLLDNLPPQAHLMIATRADPPLPIAHMRGRGQVNELRMEDLRFQVEEARSFLETFADLDLSLDDVHTLTDRTEGWVSGLQMAAASLRGLEDKTAFIQDFSGSHHYIMDYLVDEVLRRQTAQIQAFLLTTSILNRLCGPLCDALMEVTDETPAPSQGILQDLARANLFIVPLDARREWYRYHRLFADLLQARLLSKHPECIASLHRRASQWLEDHGLTDEAVQHALLTHDHGFAADLVERACQDKFMRSETMTFLRWVQRLPEEAIRKRPKLAIFRAWALLFHGAPLSTIEAQLDESREVSGPPGSSLSLQAFIALLQGQIEHGLDLAEEALQALPEGEIFLRDFATFLTIGARIALGDVEAGSRLLEQSSKASQRSGNRMATAMILGELAEMRMRQLRLQESEKLYRQALSIATDDDGKLLPIAGGALIGLGDLAFERYDLASAEKLLSQGIQHVKRWSLVGTLTAHLSMAMIHEIRGDTQAMQDTLETLQDLARRFDASEFDDIVVEMFEARLQVRRGDLEPVRRWVARRELEGAPARKPSIYAEDYYAARFYKYELPVLARLHLAEARYQEALDTLQELSSVAERSDRPFLVIESEVLQARALHAMGDTAASLAALRRALDLGQPHDLMRIFLTEGDDVIHLLQAVRAEGDSPERIDYLDRMLGKIGLPAFKPPFPAQALLEPLSPRELEVLRLLPTELTAEELAEKLIISVNTVRSHLKSIYAKMGVHSRHEAVARAAELDLL
jgi:LuxR family maltose regulon positive regulatory protein